jgi:hypothetical protein
MNNPDHISESLETIFWLKLLKFFDVDPGSGDKHPESATPLKSSNKAGSGPETNQVNRLQGHMPDTVSQEYDVHSKVILKYMARRHKMGHQFYIFGISRGLKRRMIEKKQNNKFLLLQNVWKMDIFCYEHMHLKFVTGAMTTNLSKKIYMGYKKRNILC